MDQNELHKYIQGVKDFPAEKLATFIPKARGLSSENIDTVHFIFWLIYDVEMQLKNIARYVMTKDRKDQDLDLVKNFVEDAFDEMMLSGKVSVIEKSLKREGSRKDFVKFFSTLKELNRIRNQIVHQKAAIEDIEYKGKKISERSTKNQMLIDVATGFSGKQQTDT